MPVNPTFPGIYIEELRSPVHAITAAPTSIAVFIGYTHPYKTIPDPGVATPISNFTEYQAKFGGLFRNEGIVNYLPYAVEQFFMNGGAQAYVVPLAPTVGTAALPFKTNPPTATIGPLSFNGLEPVDSNTPLQVMIKNIRKDAASNYTIFDLVITYATFATETFRGLSLVASSDNYVLKRLGGPNPTTPSALVTLTSTGPFAPFASNTEPPPQTFAYASSAFQTAMSSGPVFQAGDFNAQFAADTSLDKVDIFNLLVMPGVNDNDVLSHAIAFAEKKRAYLIIDAPDVSADGDIQAAVDSGAIPRTDHGALYFPWLSTIDELTRQPMRSPPSGFVAGIYAQTDNDRGVWKAPAGLETTLLGTTGVVADGKLTDARAGQLNDRCVDALRTFPGVGTVVFGARTFIPGGGAFDQWKYVPVRRMALFLEQTLLRNLGWVIFEPNDEPLWLAIRTNIEAFMLSLFRQGAFQGSTPDQAFQVKCDSSTTTQDDINRGVVNILVAFAPLKPAEFVVIQISQLAGQAQT